jgi:hypothetical protein
MKAFAACIGPQAILLVQKKLFLPCLRAFTTA